MPKRLLLCRCGNQYKTTESRLSQGRGKFCSKQCANRWHSRPTGLTYKIVADNKGWSNTEIGHQLGADSPFWKGDDVSYQALHKWVRKNLTKPNKCTECNVESDALQWANISHDYLRDLLDWKALCRSCHWEHDRPVRGEATERFGYTDVSGAGGRKW